MAAIQLLNTVEMTIIVSLVLCEQPAKQPGCHSPSRAMYSNGVSPAGKQQDRRMAQCPAQLAQTALQAVWCSALGRPIKSFLQPAASRAVGQTSCRCADDTATGSVRIDGAFNCIGNAHGSALLL
jgi:hypothetical protein